MSFVAPSTDVIAIASGSQSIASGLIEITLNTKNVGTTSDLTYSMDVVDIGSIELDFNYIEEVGDVSEFTVNVPRFEFEMMDTLRSASGNTQSMIGIITQLDASDLIVAKVEFNGGVDYYYGTRDQCEFSYTDRRVKVSMQHPLKYGAIGFGKTWDASLFTGKIAPLKFDDGGGAGSAINNSLYPKDVMTAYLDSLGDSTNIQYYSELYTYDSGSSLSSGDDQFIVVGSDLVTRVDTDFGEASQVTKGMALSEAAIIGNVFGYGFYVPRFSKNSDTESVLTVNDFEELELDISFKNVRYYSQQIRYGAPSIYDFVDVSISDYLINEFGANNVDVIYTGVPYVTAAEYSSTDSAFLYGNNQYTGLPAGFANKVINAFKRVFRISDGSPNVDAGSYISGKILGIDKLKPYGYFSVGSGIHPLVDNKDFRPSYLKFDLKNDIIEFEAYEF